MLVLHGGRPDGLQSADGFALSHLLMVPFGRAVARAGAPDGLSVPLKVP